MRLKLLALAVAALVPYANPASAQSNWPTRPVTLVVGFAAGGGTDVLARIVARKVSEVLGQQIIIENVGGAGGMVGSARVAKSPPDGYSIVMGTRADAINQTLYKKPAYNFLEDLVPIVLIADQPTILITPNEFPANTMPEFIEYVKKNQATLKVASAGAGSTGMIDCQLLNAAIGVNVTHVPYRGGGPAFADLIAGRIDYICNYVSIGAAAVKQGQVKAIAMLAGARTPLLPELKTADEQGLKDFDVSAWNAILLPKSATPAMVAKLNAAVSKALDNPQLRARFDAIGLIVAAPERRSPEYLRKFINAEVEKWAKPVKASGAKVD